MKVVQLSLILMFTTIFAWGSVAQAAEKQVVGGTTIPAGGGKSGSLDRDDEAANIENEAVKRKLAEAKAKGDAERQKREEELRRQQEELERATEARRQREEEERRREEEERRRQEELANRPQDMEPQRSRAGGWECQEDYYCHTSNGFTFTCTLGMGDRNCDEVGRICRLPQEQQDEIGLGYINQHCN